MDLKTFNELDDAGKAAALNLDKKVEEDAAKLKEISDQLAKEKAENADISGKLAKTEKERAEAINMLYNGTRPEEKKKSVDEIIKEVKF